MDPKRFRELLSEHAVLRESVGDGRTEKASENATWPLVIERRHHAECECGRSQGQAVVRVMDQWQSRWREYCQTCRHYRDPRTGDFTINKATAWRVWNEIGGIKRKKLGRPTKNTRPATPLSTTTGTGSTADPHIVAVVQEYHESRITRYVDQPVESPHDPGAEPDSHT